MSSLSTPCSIFCRYVLLTVSVFSLVFTGCATTPAAPDIIAHLSKEPKIRSVIFPGARLSVQSVSERIVQKTFGGARFSEDSILRGDERVVRYKLKDPTIAVIEYFGTGFNAALGVNNFDTTPINKSSVQTGFAFSFQTKLIQIQPTIPHTIAFELEATLRDFYKGKTVWNSTCGVYVSIKTEEENNELLLKLKLDELTKKCAEELLHFVGEAKYNTAVQAVATAAAERERVLKESIK